MSSKATLPPVKSDDWYVYVHTDGKHYVVDTLFGVPVHSGPATFRDIAQATMRGKMR